MDGQNSHGFVPVDLTYDDDLLTSTGWQSAGNQQYHYPQNGQDQFASYQSQLHLGQPSYEHFNVTQQPSYSSLTYENSPYGNQFQRSSDLFAPSFAVDQPIQSSQNYHTQNRSYSFVPQLNENATISPHTLQYSMSQNGGPGDSNSNLDFKQNANNIPDNFSQRSQNSSLYYNVASNLPNTQNAQSQYIGRQGPVQEIDTRQLNQTSGSSNVQAAAVPAQRSQVKPTTDTKSSLRITCPDLYESKNTSTRPRFDYAPFVTWEDVPLKITVGLKNTIPKYLPRKSRSGKDLIPGFDVSKSLTPAQISTRKRGGGQTKNSNTVLNRYKGTSQRPKILISKSKTQLADNSLKTTKTQPESSSSETDSSSESESEYDEEVPIIDVSEIRGSTRPLDIAEATRWDTIGLVWRDSNSNTSAESVKDAIEKYANFVSALRTKIKLNSAQVETAVTPDEISKLQAERKVLLESLYMAISAANEFGYGPIVENLGGHHKLVNGLTTTLIECIKVDDFVGKLPKAVLELLTKFKTLTDELLRKLKFESIQRRWNKKGDEQTKKMINTILTSTAGAKERLAKAKKDTDDKKSQEREEPSKVKLVETSSPANPNSSKRPHEGDPTNGKPSKRLASDMTNSAAIARSLVPKRGFGNLLGISTKPVIKVVPKRRDPSPPSESKLGALLASIAKDPEPPRAPEAPARASETPQEKAKRERKESRRHLRVKFKEGPDLQEIRLFKHEQAEDEGRQDGMLRDAHDDRLEGMMHKKRFSEAIDDDDDYQPSETENPYPELLQISFDCLDVMSRFGQAYTTRGGTREINSDEIKKQEKRETLELMIVYTDSSDIPYSPKEPQSLGIGENLYSEHQIKEPNEPWLVQRLQEIQRQETEKFSQSFIPGNNALSIKPNQIPDDNSTLQKLSGAASQSLTQLSDHQMNATAFATLFAWVKYLSGKPYPATEPPEWMPPEAKIKWSQGYNRDMIAAKQNSVAQIDISGQQNQMTIQSSSTITKPYHQSFPVPQNNFSQNCPQTTFPSSIPEVNQQVHGYLSNYQPEENNVSGASNFDYSNWPAQTTKVLNEGSPAPGQDTPQRWEIDRDSDKTRNIQVDNSGTCATQRSYEQQFVDPKTKYSSLFDENGEYKGKKKPCRFWAEKKCAKGAKCTFLHT
ncbi:putative zinc finger protein [Golovinomyces cichoracearum]|uniref:Putative zinc finger protein n=1 Tax=Golovinomyces cichoracearum TaxID=62708 RepID=A0A420IM76_9PEZI|nr:putative zinc finger protein [Golovinomyces cichoracearum]